MLLMGLATAFNIIIIMKKIKMGRGEDAFMDASLLVLLSWVLGGSLGGMMIATIASATISFYLLMSSPLFTDDDDEEEEEVKPKGKVNSTLFS